MLPGILDVYAQWFTHIEVHVPLREGDGDARLLELAIDRRVQVRRCADAVIDGADISTQSQVKGIVAEAVETQQRRRFFEHMFVLLRSLAHQRQGLIHVSAVGDADDNDNSGQLV